MDSIKNKLESIIDFSLISNDKVWEKKKVDEIEMRYELVLSKEYKFYLQNFGNNYVKDDYLYTPTFSISSFTKQDTYDIDSLYGLHEDNNNLEKQILFYYDILPTNIFPIGELHGGNLICMDKKGGEIYFWYHDMPDEENLYLVDNDFEQFILNFNFHTPNEKKTLNIELNFSDELDNALRKAAEKYKK